MKNTIWWSDSKTDEVLLTLNMDDVIGAAVGDFDKEGYSQLVVTVRGSASPMLYVTKDAICKQILNDIRDWMCKEGVREINQLETAKKSSVDSTLMMGLVFGVTVGAIIGTFFRLFVESLFPIIT